MSAIKLDKKKAYRLEKLHEKQIHVVYLELCEIQKGWSEQVIFAKFMNIDNLKNRYLSCTNGWAIRNSNDGLKVACGTTLFETEQNPKGDTNIPLLKEQGVKLSEDKNNFELDFNFIEAIALRIQNEVKYEPYNWQKPMDIEQLTNAMLRHAFEVKKGNFDDNGELGHLLAIAANAMFLYYQKKNHNE